MGKKCKNCYSAKVIFGEPCRSCHNHSNWKPKEEAALGKTCLNCLSQSLTPLEGDCRGCYDHKNWKPKEEEAKNCDSCRKNPNSGCLFLCFNYADWESKEEERTCDNCYYEADLLDSEGNCAECVSHYTNWKPKEKELKMKYKIVGQEIPKEDVKGVELEYGSNGKVEVLVNGFCVVCLNKNGTQYRPHNAQGSGMDTDSVGRVKLEGE